MGSKFGNIMRGFLGGKSEPTSPVLDSKNAVEYKGCLIHPASRRRDSQWLTAGVITKSFDGQTAEHQFVRADVYVSKEDADACAVLKGKRLIDERGDRLFERSPEAGAENSTP